ncbi:ectonucleoside triphosphate diphosphohydrolase 1-like [Dysidea avara]|uniref:ectonucleoside triphosphate diphosphohydrolase 1-like n=1 Tax=Dysidea avara TaxID=196820 RepID=UPI00331A1ED0
MKQFTCSWKCFATSLLIFTLLCITMVMVAGLVIIPVMYIQKWEYDYDQFGIVFTAEPDSTKMFMYKWDDRKINGTGVLTYVGNVSCIEKSITELNINDTQTHINKCIQSSFCSQDGQRKCIPMKYRFKQKHRISLYFLITDELTMLNNFNETYTDQLLNTTDNTISNYFHHRDVVNYTEIDGTSHAVSTWVTVNMKYIKKSQYYEDLVGVLYLGPVSTQLSYCQYASSDGHLHLYGINYKVQTENLMCGGWNESWRNITASLVDKRDRNYTYKHPCLPKGYTWTVSAKHLFSSSCTVLDYKEATLQFVGSPDTNSCAKKIVSLVKTISKPYEGNFTTLGRFNKVFKFFGNTTSVNSSASSWTQYNNTLNKFCGLTWSEIKTQYNVSDDDDDEVMWSRRCFEGQLVRSLLMISYRFSSSDKWTINTTLGSHDTKHWSLGYMTQQTGNNITSPPLRTRPYSSTSLILSLVELVILLVLFSLFLISVVHVSCTDKNRNGYIAIS